MIAPLTKAILLPFALLACLADLPLLALPVPQQSSPPQDSSARAEELYRQGQHAEQAADWPAAFSAYSHAAAFSPENRQIRVRLEIARFNLVQQLTDRAEKELLGGNKERARATLHSALQIDPTYAVARERLEQIEQQPFFAGDLPPLRPAPGPPQLVPRPGTRDFDIRGGTRAAYQEIARQFGLLVSFDSDLLDREVRFRVAGVDFQTAMDALSQQTDTFWVATDSRSFFVAPDTPDKRNQYAPEITVSIPLPSSATVDDMTETTRVVRDITGVRRSTLDTDTHTLTVRDTPQNVALVRELLRDIDQPRPEVLLDLDFIEVDRDAAQSLGFTSAYSARAFSLSTGQLRQLEAAQNNGTLLQVLESIFGAQNLLSSPGATGLAGLLPPLLLFGGGKSTFLATLPGATANFSRTFSLVRQAQRVLLRAKDGQPATLFVGERFPISLALLSSSLVPGQSQFTPSLSPGAFPRSDFPVGLSPNGIAAADLNADGKPDIAVVNQAANTVSILLGDGKGGFSAPADFPTCAGPAAITTGDFDRDGKLDLAIACDSAGQLALLKGNGDGTFAPAVNLAAGNGPSAILSKDFDKNGAADLAVANRTDNTISIYLGNGDGTFAARQNFAVGNAPVSLAAGDFNNDGNLDLAVANQASDSVSVLKGAGDGTFLERADLTAGAAPSAVDIADLNGDGRLDLAAANQTDNNVSVFFGDGNGAFNTRSDFKTGGGPSALLAADFNNDNVPDLVTANQQDNTFSVLLSLGNGSFAPQLALPTGNAPVALASADFNADGLRDLAVSDRASNSITVTLNTTTIPVSPNAPLTSYPASEYVDLGLKVSATPRIHPDNQVTLKLQFEISSLSGQNVNGIPVIGNRLVEQIVRLQENQTSVLGGMIQSNEMRSITGPGLPLGQRSTTRSDTELLIAITPRQIRLGPRAGRILYAGRGEGPAPAPQPPPGAFTPGESNVPPPPGAPGPAPGIAPAPGPPGPGQPGPGNLPPVPVQPGAQPDNPAPAPVQPLPVPGPPAEQGPG